MVSNNSSRVIFFDPLLNSKATLPTKWSLLLGEATCIILIRYLHHTNKTKKNIQRRNKFYGHHFQDHQTTMLQQVIVALFSHKNFLSLYFNQLIIYFEKNNFWIFPICINYLNLVMELPAHRPYSKLTAHP